MYNLGFVGEFMNVMKMVFLSVLFVYLGGCAKATLETPNTVLSEMAKNQKEFQKKRKSWTLSDLEVLPKAVALEYLKSFKFVSYETEFSEIHSGANSAVLKLSFPDLSKAKGMAEYLTVARENGEKFKKINADKVMALDTLNKRFQKTSSCLFRDALVEVNASKALVDISKNVGEQ